MQTQISVYVRVEQAEKLKNEKNQSEVVREALDLYYQKEEEKEMNRAEIIGKLQKMGAKEVKRSDVPQEYLEIIDCKEYMRFVFFADEVRYLPDGHEPHPIRSDKWEELTEKDVRELYNL